jgi:serine O-acetyltransferase
MVLLLYRIARWCYLHDVPIIPRVIRGIHFVVFRAIIPAECSIGQGTRFWRHGWCTGIHNDVEIGRECNIYNQVEIAGGHDGPGGPPIHIIIGDRVNICAGAKIICKSGTLRVGAGSTIGPNAVVFSDVPPDSLAIGVPARCVPKKTSGLPAPDASARPALTALT